MAGLQRASAFRTERIAEIELRQSALSTPCDGAHSPLLRIECGKSNITRRLRRIARFRVPRLISFLRKSPTALGVRR